MASNENQEPLSLSEVQLQSIKEAVLQSVLEVLPTIINSVTPTIIESAENIIKEKIQEMLPTPSGFVNQNLNHILEQACHVENSNKEKLNFQLKHRSDIFWKITRSNELAQLYADCLEEETPYIPQKFRENKTLDLSEAETRSIPKARN